MYAATVASLISALALIGAAGRPSLSGQLRAWSGRVQPAAAAVAILAGAVLVYDGFNHVLDGLILAH